MLNQEKVTAAMLPVIQQHFGEQTHIAACRRLTAGASADTWLIELEPAARLILRLDMGEDAFGGSVGKRAEALTQKAAFEAGVPVAEVVEIFQDHSVLGNGYLMRFVEGESLAPKILKLDEFADARSKLTEQCAASLARIHSIAIDQVDFLPEKSAVQQLDELERMHRDFGEKLPVFSLVFRWLKQHVPQSQQSSTLVHGDFRLGNFQVNEQGLAAILDWELTHRGDPIEDLGWLCVRAWRFSRPQNPVGGFGQREELIEAYEKARGVSVDMQSLLYWELFGTLKWGVICQYQAYSHLRGHARSLERAAIGRRVAETEYDMLCLLQQLQSQ